MKFVWFNLMPWPDLPDDFRQSHRSVWVDIDSALFDPERANGLYHEYMDQLEFADEMGFDGIGVNEHHQNGYGIMPSPNLIAAGLARRTSDAAICVIGNSIALYNPPIRVAEEFAMLDVISGGRLVAGFPVGTPMDTNFSYGQIPALTRDKYDEAHRLIIKAWTEDEPFSFDGKYNQLRYVNCWPKPIQKPHPPIYIPGGGSIETWDFCLEHDYNYSYLSFNGFKAGQTLPLTLFWRSLAANPDPLSVLVELQDRTGQTVDSHQQQPGWPRLPPWRSRNHSALSAEALAAYPDCSPAGRAAGADRSPRSPRWTGAAPRSDPKPHTSAQHGARPRVRHDDHPSPVPPVLTGLPKPLAAVPRPTSSESRSSLSCLRLMSSAQGLV